MIQKSPTFSWSFFPHFTDGEFPAVYYYTLHATIENRKWKEDKEIKTQNTLYFSTI